MRLREYLRAELKIIDDLHAMLHYQCPTCGNESYIQLHKEKNSLPFWRWVSGDSVDNLTFSPSVNAHKHIHFSVKDGDVINHGDVICNNLSSSL